MYVPKVCATIAVRTGVTPDKLPSLRIAAGLDLPGMGELAVNELAGIY
jgi:hypothetical protein